MTAISINLPDNLAKASQAAARKLGVSRTQFIRRAITHELQNFRSQLEQKAMAESFAAMKKHRGYLKELAEIEENFNSTLPEDEDEWWTKK